MDGWRPPNGLHRPLGLGEKPVDITLAKATSPDE